MLAVYIIIYYLAIVGPASFGLVALVMLGVRESGRSRWSNELWSKGWYRLADAARRPATIAHGYRNLNGSPWRWHVAAAIVALTPLLGLAIAFIAATLGETQDPAPASNLANDAAAQMLLFAVFSSTPFAIVYLNRLYRGRVAGAELYALAAWLAPRILILGYSTLVTYAHGIVHVVVSALVPIAIITMLGALLRRPDWAPRSTAHVAAAVAVFAIGWMAVAVPYAIYDALFSATIIGFGIYAIRARELEFIRRLGVFLRRHTEIRVTADASASAPDLDNRRRWIVLAYAALGAVAALGIYRLAASDFLTANSELGAALAVGVGALAGIGVWRSLRRRRVPERVAANLGVIAAVLAMLVVATQQIGVVFPNEDGEEFLQASRVGWSIGIAAAMGLLVWAIFNPSVYAYRALLLAFAWPSLLLLGFSDAIWEDQVGWLGASVAGILTLGTLWAMWYGTNPPPLTTTRSSTPVRYPVAVALPPTPTPMPEPATPPTVAVPALRRA